GIVVAGLIMLLGWLASIKDLGNSFLEFQHYNQIPFHQQLNLSLKNGQWGVLLSYVGLLSLISLPLIRVLLTGILFILKREKTMAFLSWLLLLGLFVSFTFGIEL